MDTQLFSQLLALNDQCGIKLEITAGLPTWEFSPSVRHQKQLFRIQMSIQQGKKSECGCFQLSDVSIRFPDGSLKRPDIALFCQEPPDSDDALELLPVAVIEILSLGSERKDIEVSAPFYLVQGVLDVILFDPRTLDVMHLKQSGIEHYLSPINIELSTGCLVTI